MRKNCFKGKAKYTGWAEWSVPYRVRCDDVDFWYKTNPSLGFHLTERDVECEVGEDDIDFNIQRLGWWCSYNQHSEISQKEWEDLKVLTMPKFKNKLYCGIKYAHDGTNVTLSLCTQIEDGRFFVETIGNKPIRDGNKWILDFISMACVDKVVVDGASGQSVLINEIKASRIRKKIITPNTSDIINANTQFETAIYDRSLCHNCQPSLTQSVSNCQRRGIGSKGGFGFESLKPDIDVTLIESVALAYWLCFNNQGKRRQKISY